jgi:hypothetical protein
VFVFRAAGVADLDICVAVQRASTTIGYAHIFDQARYPFPEQAIREEWTSRFANGAARPTLLRTARLDGQRPDEDGALAAESGARRT